MHSTQATRNLWWSKLTDESQEEIRKEPPTTNIQVFYQDLNNGIEYVSTYTIILLTHCTCTFTAGLAADLYRCVSRLRVDYCTHLSIWHTSL